MNKLQNGLFKFCSESTFVSTLIVNLCLNLTVACVWSDDCAVYSLSYDPHILWMYISDLMVTTETSLPSK